MSKRYGRLLAHLVKGLTAPQHKWRRAHSRLRTAEALVQRHEVATRHGTLVFVSTHPKALLFPHYHEIREPETLRWIDSFETPAIYWDIGANVGEFVLYTALRPDIEVVAFEPAAASYAALCRNLEANGHGERVRAFCIALGDRTQLGSLNLSDNEVGSAFNLFETSEDCFGRTLDPAFSQSTIGFTADEFRRLFGLPAPNYLKIDVDGTEAQILDGAAAMLADPALRSVLIEIEEAETPRSAAIVTRLERVGFTLTARGAAQGGVANAIFVRPA